jgi:hypothetical protein
MRTTSSARIARGLAVTYLGSLIPAFAAGLIALAASPALAQCNGCNGGGNSTAYGPPAGGSIQSFTMVLAGNVLPAIGIPSGNSGTVQEPAWADPFCNPSPTGNQCPVSAYFNPTANTTTIVYSGSTIYPNSGTAGAYHFGYAMNGAHFVVVPVSGYWSVVAGSHQSTVGSPFLSEFCDCKPTKNGGIAIVFYQATFVKTRQVIMSWNIMSTPDATARQQPKIHFVNYGNQAVEVESTGIIVGIKPPTDFDGWQTLTSMMNVTNMAPPGTAGSPFQPLRFPPPKILKPTKLKLGNTIVYQARFARP